ncbi:CHAT domain-containing protein [Qipengyuania sp. CAU 1752]
MLGDARGTIFDRKWAILCADIDRPVGSAYSLRTGGDPKGQLALSRAEPLDCHETSSDLAGASKQSCTGRETGLQWISYSAHQGDTAHVVEGLEAYDSALRLTLESLVADRLVEGQVEVVTTSGSASLAAARAATGDVDALLGQGYRRNNAGEYAEAAEFFQPDLLAAINTDPVTREARLHEVTINRALQHSNMGEFEQAERLFSSARDLATEDPLQTRLSRNFEALDSLNRGSISDALAILDRPVPAISGTDLSRGSIILIEQGLANRINAGSSAAFSDMTSQDTRLSLAERAAIIDAQARQIRGTVLRIQGQNAAARQELLAAEDSMLRVREGRVLTIARLRAQILSEVAATHEAQGQNGAAENRLLQALELIALRYPESASLNAARARLAGFYARRGRTGEALETYRSIVNSTVGESGALVGVENLMRPYFRLLVEEIGERPDLANDLFLASQLVERPGAAQTLSQLTRQLASSDSEAAELFRRATAVARESKRNQLALVQARAEAGQGGDAARVAQLEGEGARIALAQSELAAALSAYPAYRSIARTYVTAGELAGTLEADEAYIKLARLGDEYFAVYIGPGGATGWRVAANAREVNRMVAALRDSISVTVSGITSTYPFDVDSARQLYDAVFAPVSDRLVGVRHLVFEPDDAFLQLPVNLLIGEQAGVEAYHARVDQGGDEYDYSGVEWLGRDRAISTALSASSFKQAREVAASSAQRTYLGLGRNRTIAETPPQMIPPAEIRALEADCAIPLTAWDRPISADELFGARRIVGEAQSTLLLDGEFSDTALKTRGDLDQYRIVHFATHGLVNAPQPGCPARPALLTSFGGDGSDGLLRFIEIFDLNLDADLIILSACDTASFATLEATREAGVASGGGQALDGLVRAFIGAGGRQVIASHWPAPDSYDATERLFTTMFTAGANRTMGGALLSAQRQLMDDPETSHPFYWSGFALIGDARKPLFPEG